MATVHEAFGFAGRRFDTALRFCWLPVLLLMGWEAVRRDAGAAWLAVPLPDPLFALWERLGALVLLGLVPLLVAALYLGPLTRLAAGVSVPNRRSLPNRPGPAEGRFVLGTILSAGGVFLLATLPVDAATGAFLDQADALLSREVATFGAGSLHAIDTEPALTGALRSLVEGSPRVVLILGSLVFAYVSLRLFPLPYVLTAAGPGEGRSVLRRTLALSGGLNLLRLLAVIGIVFVVLQIATLILVGGILPLSALGLRDVGVPSGLEIAFKLGLSAATALLEGGTALIGRGEPATWIGEAARWATTVFGFAVTLGMTALFAGLNAGLGGALVRVAREA